MLGIARIRRLPHYDIMACTMKEQPLYQEHIVTDPRILNGKPVVKGTRLAVDLVLEELSHNEICMMLNISRATFYRYINIKVE